MTHVIVGILLIVAGVLGLLLMIFASRLERSVDADQADREVPWDIAWNVACAGLIAAGTAILIFL